VLRVTKDNSFRYLINKLDDRSAVFPKIVFQDEPGTTGYPNTKATNVFRFGLVDRSITTGTGWAQFCAHLRAHLTENLVKTNMLVGPEGLEPPTKAL
jgi:hypothetical protein